MRTVHTGAGKTVTRRVSVAIVTVAALTLASCATTGARETGSAHKEDEPAQARSSTPVSVEQRDTGENSRDSGHSEPSLPSTVTHIRGGSTLVGDMHLPANKAPQFSDVAITGEVTHIAAELNTPSGEWSPPANATDEELHRLSSELMPYTYITVAVDEVIGARPSTDVAVRSGDTVQVVILGGSVDVTYSQEQARAIGYDTGCEKTTVRPDVDDCESTAAQGPVSGKLSLAPAAEMELADDIIALLKRGSVQLNTGAVEGDVLTSVAPEGLALYRSTEGKWVNAASDKRVAEQDLWAAGRSLSSKTGKAESFDLEASGLGG